MLLSMENREGEILGSKRGRQRINLMPQMVTTEAHIGKGGKAEDDGGISNHMLCGVKLCH